MRLTVPLSHRAPPGGGYAEKGNQQKASIEASPCARRPNRPRLYCFALRTRSVFAICRCLAASSPCNPFLGCKSSTGSCAIVFCTRRENNRPQNNAPSGWRGGGGAHVMHGRCRMAIDLRIPTMSGRSTSGLHRADIACTKREAP